MRMASMEQRNYVRKGLIKKNTRKGRMIYTVIQTNGYFVKEEKALTLDCEEEI